MGGEIVCGQASEGGGQMSGSGRRCPVAPVLNRRYVVGVLGRSWLTTGCSMQGGFSVYEAKRPAGKNVSDVTYRVVASTQPVKYQYSTSTRVSSTSTNTST